MKKFLLCLCTIALASLLAVGVFAAETVIYENDFSDPNTLSDFNQYSFEWAIKDGGLYYTGTKTNSKADFGHILYNGGASLTDYIVEVDYMNVQTAGGVVFRSDLSKADTSSNGYYGYLAFIANDANKGAFGCPDTTGAWKNNINVGAAANCNLGSNVHIKATVKGQNVKIEITNLDNGKAVYTYNYTIGASENDGGKWQKGTAGLRIRAEYAKNSAKSANTAYFDNFKITTANEATLSGGTASSGTTTTTTPAKPATTIDTSNLVPVYTNKFDSAADIADFTQYRGTWAVYQGKLYLSAATGTQSYILYGGKADLVGLTDYVVDVDMYNVQTQGGVLVRSDYANVTGDTDDGIKSYMMFVSNDGKMGAIGAGQADGKWLSGNIEVSPAVMQPGMDIHIQAAVKGNLVQITITELASGKLLWQWCEANDLWSKGTFGFRLRGKATNAGLNNLNKTAFDNLVVSTFGEAKPVEKTEVKLTIGSTTAYINGKAQTLDAAPINRNNRTMLPVRFLANAFGVANEGIKWDAATRTATLTNGEVTIVVTIDAPSMTVNGKTVALDSPAIIENNRTYLPVRAIANALGVANENIKWDGATNTATLVK